jgi:hypothetical protein
MRSFHGKFIDINSSLDPVLKACPAGAAELEDSIKACAKLAVGSGSSAGSGTSTGPGTTTAASTDNANSGFTFGMELSFLGLLVSLVL